MLPNHCPVCSKSPIVYDNGYARCTHCVAYRSKLPWYKQPLAWAEDKLWWPRLILLSYMAFTAYQYRAHLDYAIDRGANIINMFDFGIHELGHVLFRPLGEFMAILGGSLFQCIFPLLWFVACWWKRWYFAASMCLVWVGFNLYDVASYAADARARQLSLATFATDYDSAHDWYQILSRTGHLSQDLVIAGQLRFIGGLFMLVGFLLGIVLIGWMIKSKLTAPAPDPSEVTPHL